MTRNEIEYLRSARTLTQAEVDARAREHDSYDVSGVERFDLLGIAPKDPSVIDHENPHV